MSPEARNDGAEGRTGWLRVCARSGSGRATGADDRKVGSAEDDRDPDDGTGT